MQNTDSQSKTTFTPASSYMVAESSIHAGCISKKQLCFTLRPYLKRYRGSVVRVFLTSERMERCGIDPDQYPRIRVFSPEATHVIISDLKKFGFLK